MAPTKKNGETPTATTAEENASVAAEETRASTTSSNGNASSVADYDMPDDYAGDPFTTVKHWVEQNPALAVAAAAGLGLVAGRLVMALLPSPEPPSLAERVEKRARALRKEATHYADDAGDVLAEKLKAAADALGEAAETAAHKAEAGYERSKDLAEMVTDAVSNAVAGAVSKKADSWFSRRK